MASHARLALPESGVGIVPGWSGTQRLARLLPEPVLKEMALFGRQLSAERAFSLGFVAELANDPCACAMDIVDKLKTTSPRATEVAKYMIHAGAGEDQAALIEALGSGMIAASNDRTEGIAAFRAKRKPEFPGT
jgi:enoyl-CoA hydratase/carnithine racemase